MAITDKYAGMSNTRMGDGEHVVTICEFGTKMSKGKPAFGDKPAKPSQPMFCVVFVNGLDQRHTEYYLKNEKFGLAKFADLRASCGLVPTDGNDELVGRKCGILLKSGKPTADGKVFVNITGYGKESDVSPSTPTSAPAPHAEAPQEIPF